MCDRQTLPCPLTSSFTLVSSILLLLAPDGGLHLTHTPPALVSSQSVRFRRCKFYSTFNTQTSYNTTAPSSTRAASAVSARTDASDLLRPGLSMQLAPFPRDEPAAAPLAAMLAAATRRGA